MIDLALEQLRTWVRQTVDVDAVVFEPPDCHDGPACISCYLLEVSEEPPLRGMNHAPLQFACHILITCKAPTQLESSSLLGRLIFAAMQHEEYKALLRPQPAELWRALGVKPMPSLLVRIPVRLERPRTPAPRVRQPLDVASSPLAQLSGVVLGPGGTPLADARVELPSLQRSTRTDAAGRFCIPGIALEPQAKQLRISARGEVLNIVVMQPPSGEVVVIHFETLT